MKKVLTILLLSVFMFSLVSAFEFDNVKDYDDKTNTVTIKNCAVWIGVCLVEGDTLAEIKLVSPINNLVGLGNQMVAELEISNFEGGNLDNMNMDFYEINKEMEGIKDLNKILAMINSYYGHFKHAFSFNLRKDIYENHLRKLCESFLIEVNYSYLRQNNEFR